MTGEGVVLRHAVQFLTRLPVAVDYDPAAMAASPRWFPAVGIVVGGAMGLVLCVGTWLWTLPAAVVISVIAGALVTGALHEDGLSDMCDGLGGGATPERAMEIMRDSRLGAYGGLALVLTFALRIAALVGLQDLGLICAALVGAHAVSRGAMVWILTTRQYLRPEGAGSGLVDKVQGRGAWICLTTMGVAITPVLVVAPLAGLSAMLGGFLGAIVIRRWVDRRLGGYTGDCLGGVQQISEIGFYLGALAWL